MAYNSQNKLLDALQENKEVGLTNRMTSVTHPYMLHLRKSMYMAQDYYLYVAEKPE